MMLDPRNPMTSHPVGRVLIRQGGDRANVSVAQCTEPQPVTLDAVKSNPALAKMSLVTSMRLSVQPVTKDEWLEVCRMAGLDPKSAIR